MPCTKSHVVNSIHKHLDIPKHRCIEAVESLLKVIKRTLANGEDVMVSGFGRFCVKHKKQRRGKNPQTREDMMLRPRRVVTFRCSGVLRDRINGKRSEPGTLGF
jgi:integration host factor subunit alpha